MRGFLDMECDERTDGRASRHRPQRLKPRDHKSKKLLKITISGGFNIFGVTKTFLGQNNIKNEFSAIKLLRVQIFSKIWQLLRNHYHRGDLYGGQKSPPGETRII